VRRIDRDIERTYRDIERRSDETLRRAGVLLSSRPNRLAGVAAAFATPALASLAYSDGSDD
jgi:hypothetical protein